MKAQKFHTDDVSLSMQIWTVTRHQYGISVVNCQTSFHGMAGLKSRELHEETVVSSLEPVITITQRKDTLCCIFIDMF